MELVKFTHAHTPYRPGEVAGFAPKQAAHLVERLGVAVRHLAEGPPPEQPNPAGPAQPAAPNQSGPATPAGGEQTAADGIAPAGGSAPGGQAAPAASAKAATAASPKAATAKTSK